MKPLPMLCRDWRWLAVVLVGLGCSMSAGDFAISGIFPGPLGSVRIDFPSDPNGYFTLFRGSNLTSIVEPVRLVLGVSGTDHFYDPGVLSALQAQFYRVRRVPLAQPLDTDGDGIDDVYELQHPGILNPLDPTDASKDFDGDGDSNYLEYLNGTDPADPYNGLFSLTWSLLNPGGIQIDAANDVWHAGRVNDVLSLGGGNILAATDHGGVWSITSGYLAAPLSDAWDKPSVNSLAAGVNGAGHFFAGGTGLYETDVSQFPPLYNWRELASPLAKIQKMIVLPASRRIVMAGDGGLRWADIPSAGSSPSAYQWNSAQGLPLISVSGLAVGPNESVLAAVNPYGSGSPERGIYRGTWSGGQLVFAPATINGVDVSGMFRTSLASCAGNLNYQYAISANATGYVHTVLRSTDGGQTWNPSLNLLTNPLRPWPALRDAAGGQGNDRNNCIGVSPVNPNLVVFGWVHGPFLSADGGDSWTQANGSPHRHDDQTSISFDPTDNTGQRFFVTSDGGIVLSSGFNGDFSSSYNRNLADLEFLHGEPVAEWPGSLGVGDFHGLLIAGGLQDNGDVFTYLGGGYVPWREYRGGDGGLHTMLPSGTLLNKMSGGGNDVQLAQIHWDPVQGNLVNFGYPLTRPGNATIYYYAAANVNQPAWSNGAGQLMYAVACDDSNVYGVYENADGTDTHLEWLGAVPPDQATKPRSIASWDGSRVLVGTMDGRLFAINSADASRSELTLPMPSPPTPFGSPVGYLAFENAQVIYAAAYNAGASRLYVSTDGVNFSLVTNGPTTKIFNGLLVDSTTSPASVFASTDDYIYLTFDRGRTWRNASAGLPRRAFCGDLRVSTIGDAWARYLYLGTFGRSAWTAQLADYAKYPLTAPGTSFSGNFIQSTWGNQGNFELLVPRGDMVYHYFRDNDAGGLPWHFKACLPKPTSIAVITTPTTPASVSLIQSRLGNVGYPGDMVAVVCWNYLTGDNALFEYTFSGLIKKWSAPRLIMADGHEIGGTTGDPALFQSSYGVNGNYELLVPQGNIVKHYARDNDNPSHPWHFLRSLPTGVVDTNQIQTHVPVNIAVMQGNFNNPGFFEAIVRMVPRAFGDSFLAYHYFDTSRGAWFGPYPLYADGVQVTNVTGNPALIQGPYGVKGNFELLVPQGDHVTHYWRDNDDPNLPWHRAGTLPTGLVSTNAILTHVPSDVALIPSNFADPGKLQAAVRMVPLTTGSPFLATYYFDIGTARWYGPTTLKADGKAITGVTGF